MSRVPVEERSLNTTANPMCEVFPKVASCDYYRYARIAGGLEMKNAICILNLNMINDKVFALLWFWHATLVIFGAVRIFTRLCQVSSGDMSAMMLRNIYVSGFLLYNQIFFDEDSDAQVSQQ